MAETSDVCQHLISSPGTHQGPGRLRKVPLKKGSTILLCEQMNLSDKISEKRCPLFETAPDTTEHMSSAQSLDSYYFYVMCNQYVDSVCHI